MMKRLLATIIALLSVVCTMTAKEGSVPEKDGSRPEDNVYDVFVAEKEMKADLLQMLAYFATYIENDFQECVATNSIGEACGCFKGENTMANDERGVRPNADLSMVCAFLAKYGKGKVTLPKGVTWDKIEDMAMT